MNNGIQFFRQYRAMLLLLVGMLIAAPLLIYRTANYTREAVLDNIRIASAHTLNLVRENLRGELARYQALPHLLAGDPVYRRIFDPNHSKDDEQRINLLLEKNKNITGALDIYIMDRSGLTLAASNWQSPRTFIGANFSYRPYFQQAMNGTLGRYFALGTTSKERGYYFSYPIRSGNEIVGVMVCKIQVGQFEQDWKNDQHEIFVTDQEGIVFLSSRKHWLFKSLHPLSTEAISRVRKNRRYDNTQILPLEWNTRAVLDGDTSLIRLPDDKPAATPQSNPSRTEKASDYLMLASDMAPVGWRVHILARTDAIKAEVWRNGLVVSILLFSMLIGAALLLERSRRNEERIDLQRRTRIELEKRVRERTQELEQAQSELIQAGKLAVLGKMSAGLSHELNQPLAAIRSYSDNAATFIDRKQLPQARQNLVEIGELTERMARIIKHLRIYARKDTVEAGPTDFVSAAREAAILLDHRMAKDGVKLIDQLPEDKVIVRGGAVRLQQVFVNILTNALDALSDAPRKEIRLNLEETDEHVTIIVSDSGSGLSENEIERVFDPFYSTKEVGQGVGLGLSISYGIIEQFGGSIDIANQKNGGARLRVNLPKENSYMNGRETSPPEMAESSKHVQPHHISG